MTNVACRVLALGFLGFSVTGFSQENFLEIPQVIQTTKTSPLFKKASSKSQQIGDVEAQTPLLARSLSPRSEWILVEDEDRNRAWIPTKFTNYLQTLAPPVSDELPPVAGPLTTPIDVPSPKSEEQMQIQKPSWAEHRLLAVGDWAFVKNRDNNFRGGLFYGISAKPQQSTDTLGLGLQFLFSEQMALRVFQKVSMANGAMSRGLDLNLLGEGSFKRSQLGFGFGYGIEARIMTNLVMGLRGGFETGFGPLRYTVGLNLGYLSN